MKRSNSRVRTMRARARSLRIETLETRAVFAADLDEVHVVFAPGTSPEVMAAYEDLEHQEGIDAFSFSDSSRWSRTSTNGTGLTQGDPTTIRWSVVPDGTPISGYNGEPAAPSNLRAFLAGIYGSNPSSSLAQNQPWFGVLQQVFDRWSAVSGVTYVYEPADDAAALGSSSSGIVGVRGDVRMSGHYIDGPSNILAYNFYPTVGDMVIDTGDNFFNNTGSNSLRLRNTIAHEAGHGLGLGHVTPTSGTKLMEPSISLGFDGPQLDDILAVNRGYGDRLEKNGGNNTPATATPLTGSTFTVETVSIDDDSDVDWYRISVGAGAALSVTLTPTGSTYTSNSTTFNALAQSDLALAVYGTNGSTILASANINGAGAAEALNNVALPGSGTYYVRVSGSANAAQLYRLAGSVTNISTPTPAPEIAILLGGSEIDDNSGAVSFGNVVVGTSATRTFTVTNSGNANLVLGTLNVSGGFSVAQGLATSVLAPGGSTTFSVAMNTSAAGTYSGTISLANSDADENPYNFSLSGAVSAPTVSAPEIAVLNGSTDINDGGSVNFGSVTAGTSATKTFTVRNLGNANLTLGTLTITGHFTLTQGLGATTLAPGGSTSFTVAMNTTATGTRSGSITLNNNDPNESPFNIALSGAVTAAASSTFSDNFNRANSSNLGGSWTERAGNFAINNGALVNNSTGTSVATVNNVTLGDVVLTADVNLGTGTATRDSGLVARHSGSGVGSQYWAGLRYSSGAYRAEIWEAVNGSWSRLSTATVASGVGNIRFEVVGTSLKLFVNGVLTNSVTDGSLTLGRVGVSASYTGARLDNFTVAAPSAAAASLPAYSARWLAALDYLLAGWGRSGAR